MKNGQVLVRGREARLWTPLFSLLCLSTLLCYSHQYLVFPVLALFVTSLGGSPITAGLVLGAFSVVSFTIRPFIGYASDRWSGYVVFLAGALILGSCGLAFTVPILALVFVSNAARGAGWASINTGGSAVLMRIVPSSRRGEASGYYNVATNSATAIAPAVALWLVDQPGAGFASVFLVAGGMALLGAAVVWVMVRSARASAADRSGPRPRLDLTALFDRGVLMAAALSVCAIATQPATTAFLPLYARQIGIENLGVYFVVGGVATILTPIAVGPFLHRGGRALWIALGFVGMGLGLTIMMIASNLLLITVAGVIYGFGSGLVYTALLALAIDRADPLRPGKAMATFSMAYQIGNAIGSPLSGVLIEWSGFGAMFLGTIGAVLVGLILLSARWSSVNQSAPSEDAI